MDHQVRSGRFGVSHGVVPERDFQRVQAAVNAARAAKNAPSRLATLALCVLVPLRLLAAAVAGVADCDEVYNYWEAAHLLAAEPSAWRRPFQTWEYAPNFALRSWAYVAPYALLAKLLAGDGGATRLTFAATRALGLALPCAVAEAALVRGVAARFGAGAGACLLGLLAASAGVFGAAPALVPSAAAMVLAAE